MPEFKVIPIREGLYSIDQVYVRCFLAVGEQAALLVDSGLGEGDIKAAVASVTALPVITVFTHADPDHVGHAADFDRRFMHPAEMGYYAQRNDRTVPMESLWEGDSIDIGRFRFEPILIPGHTPGSIALLERRHRFLIGGDSIQAGTIFMFGQGRNFEAYRASMRKLQARTGDFDIVYGSHGPLVMEPSVIGRLESTAAHVMAGLVPGEPNGRGFDDIIERFAEDGVAFFAQRQETD